MPVEPSGKGEGRSGRKHKQRRPELVDGVTGAVTHTVKAVSIYSAFSKLAQVLPLIVGLLIVALSPTAWLSGTLRRWGVGGMLIGGALGAVVFYLVNRRPADHRRLAGWALASMIVALAVLRFHLALADVVFTERNAVLRAIHDYFVGTGDVQELLYNVLAALLFAAAVFAASLGLPALGVAVVRERRAREAAANDTADLRSAEATITGEIKRVFEALDALGLENARLRDGVNVLTLENGRLRDELDALRLRGRAAAVRDDTDTDRSPDKR